MSQIEEDSLRTSAEPLGILEIHYQKTQNMWIGTIQICSLFLSEQRSSVLFTLKTLSSGARSHC